MSALRFRRATPGDAGEILGIKRAAIEELEHWQYSPEQIEAWAPKTSYLETFEEAIADDRFVIHVATDDGEVVGYGALNVVDDRIDAVYVHPAHHGRGIATALIKQLELSAEFEGSTELDVMAAKNAVPFYESVGYWELDDEVTTIEDVDLELVRMRKHLDPFDASPADDGPAETDGVADDEAAEEIATVDDEVWFDLREYAEAEVDPTEWFEADPAPED